MDLFEINKIIGAVLFSLLVILGVSIVTDAIFEKAPPERPGYVIAGTEEEEPAEDTAAAEAEPGDADFAQLLADADAAAGQRAARRCTACHTFDEGGPNRVGPNLHGIVGSDIASAEGFAYSAGLRALEGSWDYERLNSFIEAPRAMVPDTIMAFAGIRSAKERADLLAYLHSVSPGAPPLAAAAPDQEPAAEEEAPVQEEAEEPAQEEAAEPEPEQDEPAERPAEPAEEPAEEAEDTAAEQPATQEEAGGDAELLQRIAAGDPDKGRRVARRCAACHTFDEGGANRVGPNLYGVVGREVATGAGFSYSDALKALDGTWDYERLDSYIEAPRQLAPRTTMAFAGIRSAEDRADLIAYMRTLSPDAPPLP